MSDAFLAPPVATIPAGYYRIGNDALEASRPTHTVHLAGFLIALGAVTNEQFAAFIHDRGYADSGYWTTLGWRWQRTQQKTTPSFWDDPKFNQPAQPVVGIGWYEAYAFTRWLREKTKLPWRLPTEIEWEAAARAKPGTAPLIPASEVNTSAQGIGQPWAAVGQGNVAWCGAQNMLGNVWEWTSTRWGHNWQTMDYSYPYSTADDREDPDSSHARVMRGGSWFDPPSEARPEVRARYLPGSRASNIGFRIGRGL